MFTQGFSFLRRAFFTAAAMILGLSTARSLYAQPPIPTGGAQGYREPGPIVPEMLAGAGGPQTRTSTGRPTLTPVLTPGYFEVVCPAMCYGGAFHVCGNRGYGGAGYYGPFRRLWGYGTYGPNFNIGPDNSLQYGLVGGVIYQAQRKGKGLCKHGHDCATCRCPHGKRGGSAAAAYETPGQIGLSGGASPSGAQQLDGVIPQAPPRPPEKLPQPTPNAAHLQLLVPENAEVLVEGQKTTTTGTVREFDSPPLPPGKNMIYAITVRYPDASGKPIEQTHSIRVRANDQLRIDCTHPSAAQAAGDAQPRATVQRP